MKNVIMVVLVGLTLSSCAFNSKPEVVVETRIIYKPLLYPRYLLKPCNISRPIDQRVYINSTYIEKEDFLINYILSLLTDIDKCNVKLKSLANLQKKYSKGIKSSNDK